MKVLIVSLAYLPFIGGAEIAVKEITDRINDIDFDMVTVNLDGKQQGVEQIGNVKIYRLGKGKLAKYFFPFSGFKKAKELHQQNKYDVVWAIMANQAGLVSLRFKKKFPQVKYLLTLQEGDSLKRIWSRTWFMRSAYRGIYQRADRIQAISNFLARRGEKYGFTKEVDVVPNGVDLEKFQKDFSDEELSRFRNKLGLDSNDKIVITTSRLVYKNGIDTLIQAVKDLDVKVLILGSGVLDSKLKALAQELGVKDKILFLDHIDPKELPRYLKASDVFVRASRSEGLGVSFLEAMGTGLPIIATKVGGIPDFLIDQETGLFCEVDNPSDLASKIQMILSDETLRQKLISNGRNLVLEKYDWQPIAAKMNVIFQNLCQRS